MPKYQNKTHLALALDNCSICSLKSTTISWCFFLSKCAVSSDSKCTSSRSLRNFPNSASRLRLTSTCTKSQAVSFRNFRRWKFVISAHLSIVATFGLLQTFAEWDNLNAEFRFFTFDLDRCVDEQERRIFWKTAKIFSFSFSSRQKLHAICTHELRKIHRRLKNNISHTRMKRDTNERVECSVWEKYVTHHLNRLLLILVWESEVKWRNLSNYIISTISDKVAIFSPYFSFRLSFKWKLLGCE